MTLEVVKQFTRIAYEGVDFLIPSEYIVAGFYQHIQDDAPSVYYNRETLPHIHLTRLLEEEFKCQRRMESGVVLVLRMQDFANDVCVSISDYTNTAFPASGFLALSINGEIQSEPIECSEIRQMPLSIRTRLNSCGIDGIRFPEGRQKQLLIAPDLLIRKFFAGALL